MSFYGEPIDDLLDQIDFLENKVAELEQLVVKLREQIPLPRIEDVLMKEMHFGH